MRSSESIFVLFSVMTLLSGLSASQAQEQKVLVTSNHRMQYPQIRGQLDQLMRNCSQLSKQGIPYQWGGTSNRGMDCSAAIQHVFSKLGATIPRTSTDQANHLARLGSLWRVAPWETQSQVYRRLRPGDIVFWARKTSPNTIRHVMVYMGRTDNGKYRMWGAQGTNVKGINGSGVDYHDYSGSATRNVVVAHGRVPGF